MSCKALNVIALLIALHICAAANNNDDYSETYYDSKTNAVAPGIAEINSGNKLSFQGSSCNCQHLACSCCTGVRIKRFHFNKQVCAVINFDSNNLAVTAAVTVNQKKILSTTHQANSLPPMCVKVPEVPAVKLCLHFTNLSVSNHKLGFCTNLETRIPIAPTLALHFPCAKI